MNYYKLIQLRYLYHFQSKEVRRNEGINTEKKNSMEKNSDIFEFFTDSVSTYVVKNSFEKQDISKSIALSKLNHFRDSHLQAELRGNTLLGKKLKLYHPLENCSATAHVVGTTS